MSCGEGGLEKNSGAEQELVLHRGSVTSAAILGGLWRWLCPQHHSTRFLAQARGPLSGHVLWHPSSGLPALSTGWFALHPPAASLRSCSWTRPTSSVSPLPPRHGAAMAPEQLSPVVGWLQMPHVQQQGTSLGRESLGTKHRGLQADE